MSKAKEITLIGVISALCIASRVMLQFLPNIKPVTSIIILMTQFYGLRFGIETAVATTLVSNMLLGMGTWTVFQILAWVVISALTSFIDLNPLKHKYLTAIFTFFTGYIYGFIVSLEQFFYGGFPVFAGYWLAGLTFDTFHAVGNVVFYPICYYVVKRTSSIKVVM